MDKIIIGSLKEQSLEYHTCTWTAFSSALHTKNSTMYKGPLTYYVSHHRKGEGLVLDPQLFMDFNTEYWLM